jgi:tetratricopeptide (TPR) repeat protein
LKTQIISGLLASFLVAGLHAAEASDFAVGQKALQEGRLEEAFSAFLQVPGAEHLAIRVARPKAAEFLNLLATASSNLPPARVQLIEGDLQLALGKKDVALRCYRTAALKLPAREYPVEPPTIGNTVYSYRGDDRPVHAFEAGPGSHRDNWLLRRFIALEAWEDASREFVRICNVHCQNTKPHVQVHIYVDKVSVTNRVWVTPCGFDGRALQFALDYAYFLKQRGDTNAALTVLLEPLLAMDMDRLPTGRETTLAPGENISLGENMSLPERYVSVLRNRGSPWTLARAGISRKEYIRLAYGEFKGAGQVEQLDKAFGKMIAERANWLRRVWARIRLHEGLLNEAVALERAYIETAHFDPVSTAIRMGQVYEDVGRTVEAAAEYEKALTLAFVPPVSLPDEDEEAVQNSMTSQMPALFLIPGRGSVNAQESIHRDLLSRLQRLYSSLGKSDRAMEVSLRLMEGSEHEMGSLQTLEQTVSRFRTAGKEAEIMAWIATRSSLTNTPPHVRANLRWLQGDKEGTITAIAEGVARKPNNFAYTIAEWKERFRNAGIEPYRRLLQALVEANPLDMQTQLERLDALGRLDTPDIIPVLEKLLESDALPAFQRGKGAHNRTQFRNYPDLAYRLLRLYERHPGHEEKLLSLGFRMLEGEEPFSLKASALSNYRANWNNSIYGEVQAVEDTLQGLYVFLTHLKEKRDIERAARLIEKSGCIPLLNQVNRLRADQKRPRLDPASGHSLVRNAVKVRTAELPAGVRVLSNRDDVRAIAPDATWGNDGGRVWIGTSWGLVRYCDTGKALDVLQIPTGAGVTTFCDTPSGLYVGTRDGLFRLDDVWGEQPCLIRVGVEKADGKERDRIEKTIEISGQTRTDRIHEVFPVSSLRWWNAALWVCSNNGSIYRYDPKTKASLYLEGGGLIVGCGKLWGEKSFYDPVAEEFKAIDVNHKQWHIIGATEHEVWADAYVNNELRHRPAILDPETFAFTVLPISGLGRSDELQNSDFRLLGESNGVVWLAGNNPNIVVTYNRKTKTLRKTADPVPADLSRLAGEHIASALAHVKLALSGDRGPTFCSVPAGGGRLLVGASLIREWQEDNLGYDDNTGMSHHIQDLEGGLFLVDPAAGTWSKIGTQDEELSDFYVKRCVRDNDRLYVCSNGGVTILSLPDGKIIGRITVSDGLPSNKVEDVARIGDRLYLACELGDDGGGLAVMDLKTGLIQTLSKSDGLKCNKIKRLRVEGDRLHILYGTIYSVRAYGTSLEKSVVAPVSEEVKKRWPSTHPDDRASTFRSSILNTKTGLLSEGDEILPSSPPPGLNGETMPILGGYPLFSDFHAGNLTILAGTHGMMLSTTSLTGLLARTWPEEAVVTARSARQQQVEESLQRPMTLDLAAALNDPNPFYRTRVAASLLGKEPGIAVQIPALIHMVDSPEIRERCTALFLLSTATPTPDILATYEKLLKDRDASIRGFAALQLCKNDRIPDLEILREVIQRDHEYSNFPFGIDSTIGCAVDRDNLYIALASQATAPIFALVLGSPPSVSDYEPQVALLKQFAASLNRHPEAAEVLLAAHDAPHIQQKVPFVTAVFGYAGKSQVPQLHAALKSKDRVVRSNAARACGAIDDPSSIPLLLKALDMESGLARASIVIALGKLNAKEAMPRLTELYIDAQNDEKRRRGSGFMAQQIAVVHKAQYDSIRNLDALSGDWDEIKQSSLASPADPREGEELLSPDIILSAVAKIGPSAARDFYRMLAGGKDTSGRVQAALHLAGGEEADREANVAILKNLLSDDDEPVKITAAVSLLVCGEEVAKRPLLEWLESGSLWTKRRVVMELLRVKERQQLAFLNTALKALQSNEQTKDFREVLSELLK